MSTELPVLPHQLIDTAERQLADGNDEAAAQTFELLAAHAQHLAKSIRRYPGYTAGNGLAVPFGAGPAYQIHVGAEGRLSTSLPPRDPHPTPTSLILHAIDVIAGLVGPAAHRAAATHDGAELPLTVPQICGGAPGIVRVVPDIGTVLDHIRQLWWEQLSGPDHVAVRVHQLCHARPAIPVDDVLAVCRLAARHGVAAVRLREHTTYTLGTVEPGDPGVWVARVGNAPHQPPVGEYGSIRAAGAAVWDTIAGHRQDLRDQFRATSTPLARLAGRAWTDPAVTVIASRTQRAADNPDLVTTGQIAHRARVHPALARTWANDNDTFPAPADQYGRTWAWPHVDRWLTAVGHKPTGGYAPDRPALADDAHV
jgi:hypothetical protein